MFLIRQGNVQEALRNCDIEIFAKHCVVSATKKKKRSQYSHVLDVTANLDQSETDSSSEDSDNEKMYEVLNFTVLNDEDKHPNIDVQVFADSSLYLYLPCMSVGKYK